MPVFEKSEGQTMLTTQHQQAETATKGSKPGYQLWLVVDQGEKKSRWVKLTGLWPTKDGDGLTGQLQSHVTVPPGSRLVILPAKQDDATEVSE
jgi:hypothetical protein